VITLKYSLVTEATGDPSFFGFYAPDMPGFTGVGTSIEECVGKARVGMDEHVALLPEQGMTVRSMVEFGIEENAHMSRVLRGRRQYRRDVTPCARHRPTPSILTSATMFPMRCDSGGHRLNCLRRSDWRSRPDIRRHRAAGTDRRQLRPTPITTCGRTTKAMPSPGR
jgi:predicted RNase H-like HicB family nuclease